MFCFVYMVVYVCWICLFWVLLGVALIACYSFEVLRLFMILLGVGVLWLVCVCCDLDWFVVIVCCLLVV